MISQSPPDSFRELLLRYRGRSGLTQRQVAERVGTHRRSVQEWENGATYPTTNRLEALIEVLLEADGLTPGQEAVEAEALWTAVEQAAPHAHAPFPVTWFAQLLARRSLARATPAARTAAFPLSAGLPSARLGYGARERRQDGARPQLW